MNTALSVEREAHTHSLQTQLFIDGRFVPSLSGDTLAVMNPHDNSKIADIALAVCFDRISQLEQ